jgi:hypothetical protein
MNPGTLVRHRVWGLGKVIEAPLPHLIIHFTSLATDPAGPRRKLQALAPQLSLSDVQSDPELDQVSLVTHTAKSGKPRAPRPKAVPKPLQHSFDQALAWFKTTVPGGFRDEKFVADELKDKRLATQEWALYFGNGKGEALLAANDTAAISDGLTRLFQATKIPAPFETMAAREGFKNGEAASRVLRSVLDYVEKPDAASFAALVESIKSLPVPGDGARVLTWPNVTLLPFLADPKRFMVLKPTVAQRMARRMGFALAYAVPPAWPCYESMQAMSTSLLEKLAADGAQDFIDVHAFTWVTRDLE